MVRNSLPFRKWALPGVSRSKHQKRTEGQDDPGPPGPQNTSVPTGTGLTLPGVKCYPLAQGAGHAQAETAASIGYAHGHMDLFL